MRVLVYGLGRSGIAVATLLAKQQHEVIAFDQQLKPSDVGHIALLGGRISDAPLDERIDLCIAAPGVPYDHADLQALRSRGIETIGEVEWVGRTVSADIIGITGTAGKTSTTQWLTEILQAADLDARAGGNIDPALAAVAEDGAVLVAELSSFGLERAPSLKPDIAVVLNLGSDHLDRHGSLEKYHAAKRAIINNQTAEDVFVYNADDSILCSWAAGSSARTLGFSTTNKADAYLAEGILYLAAQPFIPVKELQVSGDHQLGNALAVMLAASAYGLPDNAIKRGLRTFSGVAGRYSEVARLGDIRFIEDSIATRTLAVKAALTATPAPIVWILGGADKGASFTELRDVIKERVSLAVGVGEAGKPFLTQLEGLTTTVLCNQQDGQAALSCACQKAVSHLRNDHGGQGTVLLAPLAASFDQFDDYKDRARTFRDVVAQLMTRESA